MEQAAAREVEAILQRALALLDEAGLTLPAIHVSSALDALEQIATGRA